MTLLITLLLLFPLPPREPVRFDLVTLTYANFSTPFPCVSWWNEPVIAVYYADYDYDYEDAWFVSDVDGCHYQLVFGEAKPITMMCLAWPMTDVTGIWLRTWDERTELWCWMLPKTSLWIPKIGG